VPEQGPARIVHGDYGLHNTLVGTDGRIAAVVDWEISTLGDPLADLGYALNQWAEPTDPPYARYSASSLHTRITLSEVTGLSGGNSFS
jgi:aminoglycoside phosphotransferase (APT) family kinase protein